MIKGNNKNTQPRGSIKREYLYLVAAILWGVPGVVITLKGIIAYINLTTSKLWLLLAITICVSSLFFVIFHKIVKNYSTQIALLPNKTTLWQTFPPRGWFLLIVMVALGISIRQMELIPVEFIASFYSGLGPMLILAAINYIRKIDCK